MKKIKLDIIATAKGVENSLVCARDSEDADLYYVSIQSNKHIKSVPKTALVTDSKHLELFTKKLQKELEGHNCPKLKMLAELTCNAFDEIIRIYKVDNHTFDVCMYFNYKSPYGCEHYVPLTDTDLSKFLEQLR